MSDNERCRADETLAPCSKINEKEEAPAARNKVLLLMMMLLLTRQAEYPAAGAYEPGAQSEHCELLKAPVAWPLRHCGQVDWPGCDWK